MTDHKAHVRVLKGFAAAYTGETGEAFRAAIAALTAAPEPFLSGGGCAVSNASEGEDGAGVAFDSAEALADWLETLHEAEGPAVMCGKWRPAQVAARAIREYLTRPAAQVAATPKHDEGRDFDTWHDSQWPAPGRHAPYGHTVSWRREKMQRRVVWDAALATQPAARRVTDDPRLAALIEAAQKALDKAWEYGEDEPHFASLNAALESFAQPAEGVE